MPNATHQAIVAALKAHGYSQVTRGTVAFNAGQFWEVFRCPEHQKRRVTRETYIFVSPNGAIRVGDGGKKKWKYPETAKYRLIEEGENLIARRDFEHSEALLKTF